MFGKSKQRSLLNLRHWNSALTLRVLSRYPVRFPAANLIGLLLCYVIGAYGCNPLFMVPIFLMLVHFWVTKDRCLQDKIKLAVERKSDKQKAIDNAETLKWINFVVDKWWSCNTQAVSNFAKDWIEPIVDKFKLPVGIDSIEIVTFNTGTYRPHVSNLRLLEQTMAGADSYEPVTMATMTTPPGAHKKQSSLVFEVDIEFDVPKANFILKIRVGHKKFGQNFEMNVDSFHLIGRLRCFVNASASTPFPHLTTGKVTFVKEPHIEASCKVLKKTVEVFDVPILRDVVTEYIIYGFNKLLVYPDGIDMDFSPPTKPNTEWETLQKSGLAQGVLAVTITGVKPEGKVNSTVTDQYCSLKLGSQKCVRQFGISREPWSSTFSFLVHSLQEQQLSVKVKGRRMLKAVTMATRRIELQGLGFKDSRRDKPIFRKVSVSGKGVNLVLTLCYSPLPTFSLIGHDPPRVNEIHSRDEVAGVLYTHVHGAKDLIGYRCCDPYCTVAVTTNTKKNSTLLCTRSIAGSPNPIWEQGMELFVPDYTTVKLKFEVTNRTARYGHLGSTTLDLRPGQVHLIQHSLPLTLADNKSKAQTPLRDCGGSLYISVLFRPVESVSHTVRSLIVDYVTRTHKHSLSHCLDLTTGLLNPAVHAGGVQDSTCTGCYSNEDSGGDYYSDSSTQ